MRENLMIARQFTGGKNAKAKTESGFSRTTETLPLPNTCLHDVHSRLLDFFLGYQNKKSVHQ